MNVVAPEAPAHDPIVGATGPAIRIAAAGERAADQDIARETVIELQDLSCYYGAFRAVRNVTLEVKKQRITALIGPSGCGKSTLIRTVNRMNDLVPGYRTEGKLLLDGQAL